MTPRASADPSAGPVVLFDLDDTLMAHREAVADGILQHMRSRAYLGDETEAARHWHELEEQHYLAYLGGSLTFEGQRQARAADFARRFGHELDAHGASRWFAEYFERYRDAWALHDDVLPALDALATALAGVRFGVITNGELEFQTAKLARLGLLGRFEHVVASGAVRVTKPDARIFRVAVELFEGEAPVSAAAYIGDRLTTDAIGAARAGLVGVWLNRGDESPTADEAAAAHAAGVLEIGGLGELPALLARCWPN
jgi:putative hydrolase of the HAD superfamily